MVIVLMPKARTRLLEKGFVVTFKTGRHPSGQDWVVDGGRKVAVYVTEPVRVRLTVEELKPYVAYSGFDSAVEWIAGVRKAYGRASEGFLHLIVKKPATSEALLEAVEVPNLGLKLKPMLVRRLREEYAEFRRAVALVPRRWV